MTKPADAQAHIESQTETGSGLQSAPLSQRLVFSMQQQQQRNWAWAAVAASVAAYYDQTSRTTQCMLANWAFGQTMCCQAVAASSVACDQPYSVGNALAHHDNLHEQHAGGMALAQIVAEINAGRPVVTSIAWQAVQVSHPVVIVGYDMSDSARPLIELADSAYGKAVLPFDGFPRNYHGAQAIRQTCLTQPSR
ncbi:Peptidase_C39 like family protein [Andreprevotia lacus DSM 23236]|jgi:hypothetical protein|uniref:Peptidase_C39 like family protein n=1 Tax=Andreprevotia lacus DSM 23236 TaxID=1121001 RepID=A0A1W1XTQ6_9NEIS|nr:papain-like cysteine protease family protein [Andreprevotia lacus]SMC26911.1 Peptidase_C39 like family protein [Andreprevotia lacus DSM 23236]